MPVLPPGPSYNLQTSVSSKEGDIFISVCFLYHLVQDSEKRGFMDLDALYRFLGRECLTMAWTPRSCICAYRHWRCVCLCIYPSTQLYSCFRDSVRQVSKVQWSSQANIQNQALVLSCMHNLICSSSSLPLSLKMANLFLIVFQLCEMQYNMQFLLALCPGE